MSARPEPDPRRARLRTGAGAALVLVLVGLAIAVFVSALSPHASTEVVPVSTVGPDPDVGAVSGAGVAIVYVHVLGQVDRPGLYELREGDRIVDAVAAAGGFTPTADPGGVNLAQPLIDGEQLYVPAVGEVPPPSADPPGTVGGLIDLNSADVGTLDTLPRIGPATAQRIVDWRESHGRFSSVDDLLAISGIGAKTVDGLRALVTVG